MASELLVLPQAQAAHLSGQQPSGPKSKYYPYFFFPCPKSNP